MTPLIAMTLSPETLALIAACAVLGIFIAQKLYSFDDRVEQRREEALDIVKVLSANGFNKLPDILGKYAIGNYDEGWRALKQLAKDYKDPKVLEHDLENVFDKMVERKVKNEETRKAFFEKMHKLEAQYTTPAVPTTSATPTVKSAAA